MSESAPTKKKIELLFKKLRSVPTNKVCFDCNAKNPTWASVTYGVFICIDCSAVHRSLGVHLTFVRSTQLDTNWTWTQLIQMEIGGNANAESFFQQHNCTTKDSQQKYNSRAAQLYKEKLHNAAVQAISVHGPKLNLEHDSDAPQTSTKKDFDFFDVHSTDNAESRENAQNSFHSGFSYDTAVGGNINADNYVTSDPVAEESGPKHIIGNRKGHSRRGGIGSRKSGGLGAQKISTNFADIEKEAELVGKLKMQEGGSTPVVVNEAITPEEKSKQITSMRLVYDDISLKQKTEEEKLKAVDPRKAKQMERLGMGFATRSGISHSAVSDMKTIHQENLTKQKSPERDDDDYFELDFGLPSSNSNSDFLLKNWSESRSSRNMPESRSFSSLREEARKYINTKCLDDITPHHSNEKSHVVSPSAVSNEAQKKFGSAKSISSEQFFSDNSDNTWERSANLSRFEGSSSISSADYFNRNENIGRSSGATGMISSGLMNAPDLDDVKESVRQGVTKVAGRLSSLANGVMSTIQEKYGY